MREVKRCGKVIKISDYAYYSCQHVSNFIQDMESPVYEAVEEKSGSFLHAEMSFNDLYKESIGQLEYQQLKRLIDISNICLYNQILMSKLTETNCMKDYVEIRS